MTTTRIDLPTSVDALLEALPEFTLIEVHEGSVVMNPPRTAAHQIAATIVTFDSDFDRFAGVRWLPPRR
jgi:hypothetical protein